MECLKSEDQNSNMTRAKLAQLVITKALRMYDQHLVLREARFGGYKLLEGFWHYLQSQEKK